MLIVPRNIWGYLFLLFFSNFSVVTRTYINIMKKVSECLVGPVENLVNFIIRMAGETASMIGSSGSSFIKKTNSDKNTLKSITSGNKQYADSLRGQVDKFILQYPLVVSNSISMDGAESVRDLLEVTNATLIQYRLDNTPVMEYYPHDSDLFPEVHRNVNLNANHTPKIDSDRSTLEENKNLLLPEEDRLETSSLNEYTLPRDYLNYLAEKAGEDYRFDMEKADEVINNVGYIYRRATREEANSAKENLEADNIGEEDVFSEGDFIYEDRDGYLKKVINSKDREVVRQYDIPQINKVSNVDINKQNRSVPITMTSKINYLIYPNDENGNPDSSQQKQTNVEMEISFGVKAVMHLVESEDVVFFLGDSGKNSNLLTKLVKLTTGEIKLVKDVLLRKDRKKKLARSGRDKNKVWKNLDLLGDTGNVNRFYRKFGGASKLDIVPTTTLLISIDEVDAIKADIGKDILNDKRFSDKIYSDLYLANLMILDEPNEILYIYDANTKTFERQDFSKISSVRLSKSEKEKPNSKKLANKLKQILS